MTTHGEAIAVVKSGLLPRTVRCVPVNYRLPRLPLADVRLHRAPVLSDAARRLADHLTAAFSVAAH